MKQSKHKPLSVILILYLLYLTGCITSYDPGDIKDTAGILVVEGEILEPVGTTIRLSRTKKVNYNMEYEKVNNAIVSIISDDGAKIADAEFLDEGIYTVNEEILFRENVKYALDVQIGNKQYQSAFLIPSQTPDISNVTWVSKDNGKEVEIQVSTNDPSLKTKHYRWKYKEDWEIVSEIKRRLRYNPQTHSIDTVDYNSSKNTMYCWGTDHSKDFILGTTNKLSENYLKNKPILNIKAGDNGTAKFSYLYSILIKQHGIDNEAYDYFLNLQKNIEQTGSIFSPHPTELEGNIICISDPEEPVIGYVYATREKTKRIYINADEVPEMGDKYYCVAKEFGDFEEAFSNGYEVAFYSSGQPKPYICYLYRCVDCTKREGTKIKPDFWPNDHL